MNRVGFKSDFIFKCVLEIPMHLNMEDLTQDTHFNNISNTNFKTEKVTRFEYDATNDVH